MPDLAPLQRRSIVDEAYDALQARILHGTWAPGEKLPTEHELAAALGVGRSTVREALNRLGSAGLVEIPHGGSKRVRDFRDHAGLEVLQALVVAPDGSVDTKVVRAAAEMRAALAPDMARLAASRRSHEQALELVAMADALPHELEPLLLAVLDWWRLLVLSSDNLAYRLAFNTLMSTHRDSRPVLRAILAEELSSRPHYCAISSAVAARQPEEAERATRSLVALGTHALLTALSQLDPGETP